jgi:hypothetical protein
VLPQLESSEAARWAASRRRLGREPEKALEISRGGSSTRLQHGGVAHDEIVAELRRILEGQRTSEGRCGTHLASVIWDDVPRADSLYAAALMGLAGGPADPFLGGDRLTHDCAPRWRTARQSVAHAGQVRTGHQGKVR